MSGNTACSFRGWHSIRVKQAGRDGVRAWQATLHAVMPAAIAKMISCSRCAACLVAESAGVPASYLQHSNCTFYIKFCTYGIASGKFVPAGFWKDRVCFEKRCACGLAPGPEGYLLLLQGTCTPGRVSLPSLVPAASDEWSSSCIVLASWQQQQLITQQQPALQAPCQDCSFR